MKTRILATIAALTGLVFSTASSAAWYAQYEGVKGSSKSTANFKNVGGLKGEQEMLETHATRSQKPKEIVVVGLKPNQKVAPQRPTRRR